jgi:mannan endo-1,4-beta-mannosidase
MWYVTQIYTYSLPRTRTDLSKGTQSQRDALSKWQCTMAETIKSSLGNNGSILVSTGGGSYLATSLLDQYFTCAALDVLAIHAYGVGDFETTELKKYVDRAKVAGKKLIMQEWGKLILAKLTTVANFTGACYTNSQNNKCNEGSPIGASTRDANIKNWAAQIDAAGIPWFYWQILPNPDPHHGWDYEVGINDVNWGALKDAGIAASRAESAFDFSQWLL